jgi:hypothetical protein
MSTQPTFWDITAGKHGGDPQSKAANLRAHPHKAYSRELVMHVLRIKGDKGATCREVSEYLNLPMHKVNGRLTELVAMGRAFKTSQVRDGGRVIQKC